MHEKIPGHGSAVGRVAGGYDAGGKFHRPGDILLDGIEAAVVIDDRRECLDLARLFAGEIAGGIEAVDAYVHQWSAASQRAIDAPLASRDVEAESALDGLHLADLSGADYLDGLDVHGVVLAAIGDHQL